MITRRKDLKMEPETQKELLKCMRRVMQEPSAKTFFNEPVDPEALGIPEYPLVIKEPMDLGIIFWKLKDFNYKYVKHFFDDLNLVWSNCQKFNQKGSSVFVASERLDQLFQKLWNRSKKSLKLEEDDVSLGLVAKTSGNEITEGTKRKRLSNIDSEIHKSSASSQAQNSTKPSAKLKIKLSKSLKKDQEGEGLTSTRSGKEKNISLNSTTIQCLELCIGIFQELLSSSEATSLSQASTGIGSNSVGGVSFMSLAEIYASLIEAKERNWVSSQYSSSKDVLHEAQLFLKNQAVNNEHKRKKLKACNELLEQLESSWINAGMAQDLEGLKQKGKSISSESTGFPDSNLRVTKARVEKIRRQQMEREVKEAQNAISELESLSKQVEMAKTEMEKLKDKSREQVREWSSLYNSQLNQLNEFTKQKAQVQRRKDRALASIASAKGAMNRFQEKQEKVRRLKEEEKKLLEAFDQHHFELEIQPRDAVIVDLRTYSPKRSKANHEPAVNISELGSYWFSLNK